MWLHLFHTGSIVPCGASHTTSAIVFCSHCSCPCEPPSSLCAKESRCRKHKHVNWLRHTHAAACAGATACHETSVLLRDHEVTLTTEITQTRCDICSSVVATASTGDLAAWRMQMWKHPMAAQEKTLDSTNMWSRLFPMRYWYWVTNKQITYHHRTDLFPHLGDFQVYFSLSRLIDWWWIILLMYGYIKILQKKKCKYIFFSTCINLCKCSRDGRQLMEHFQLLYTGGKAFYCQRIVCSV